MAKSPVSDRRTILFLLFFLPMGGLLGLLFFWLNKKDIMSLGDSYLLGQAVVLLLGIFHLWFMYDKLLWSKRNGFVRSQDSFFPEALYTLLASLALTAGCLAVMFYFTKEVAVIFWSVGAIFLMPFLFLKTFDFLQQIPLKDYKVKWFFSRKLIGENDWNWSNEMWISFEVKESWNKPGIHRSASFRILAPRHIPLGEIFRLAVREYNKQGNKIVVQDLGFEPDNQDRFWWLFSLKFRWNKPHTWFPNFRYLDPNDSALANALRPGDLVKARRISTGNNKSDEIIPTGQIIPQ
ncbi:MAG: TssN family type VI secretion system protein [Saprospiraceae bacterium]